MRILNNVLIVALMITAAAVAAMAQTDTKVGEADSKFDKAKNETTYEVRALDLSQAGASLIKLNASVIFAGTKLDKVPDFVLFIVQIGSHDRYKYPESMAMKVKIDGKSSPDVVMLNLDKRQASEWYLETIGTRMNYNLFKSIAHAKSVELQLDTTTLVIDAARLAKFADLDKMLNP